MSDVTSRRVPTCGALSDDPEPLACELAPGHDGVHQAGLIGQPNGVRAWPDRTLHRWVFCLLCSACGEPLHPLPTFEATPFQLRQLAAGVPLSRCKCFLGRPAGHISGSFLEVNERGERVVRVETVEQPAAAGLPS